MLSLVDVATLCDDFVLPLVAACRLMLIHKLPQKVYYFVADDLATDVRMLLFISH